ncbi:hypothetical protein ACFP9V_26835 [Deinococcus radiopugnans]|uniref:Uncharacterized protein n=1 Tax=Deinococcus radiopugnans ATCC 19172 TaxID=585398 RepID=A0A5C4XII8_9DEIO|nr:hypothetical protein [Deinococcus radiopugnans]MBB6018880.1 hypothetical protein [Deinococcus radiopugnans ATCC 19172]TNM62390.1 hypothetical protein FHR04_20385 [Deinococcus radiopugnans ATCC 19172]
MISASDYFSGIKLNIFVENKKVVVSYSSLEEVIREEFETIEDALTSVSKNSKLDSHIKEDVLDQARFLSDMIVYEDRGI